MDRELPRGGNHPFSMVSPWACGLLCVLALGAGELPPPLKPQLPRLGRTFSAAEEARLISAYLKLLREAPEATVEVVDTDILAAVERYGIQARAAALRVRGIEKLGHRDLFQFMQHPDRAWMAGLDGPHWNCMLPAPGPGPAGNR